MCPGTENSAVNNKNKNNKKKKKTEKDITLNSQRQEKKQ